MFKTICFQGCISQRQNIITLHKQRKWVLFSERCCPPEEDFLFACFTCLLGFHFLAYIWNEQMRICSQKRTLKPQLPAEKEPVHSSHPLSSSESPRAPRRSPRYLQHQRVRLLLDNDSYVKAGALRRMFSHAAESARPSLRTTHPKTQWTSWSRWQQSTNMTVESKFQSSKLSASSFEENILNRGKLWGKRQKL